MTKTLLWLSILWAGTALAVQIIRAGRRRPGDFSRRAGNPGKGMLYNFTAAMRPTHKESARRHPVEFSIGMVLHAGAILSLASVFLLLLWPTAGSKILGLGRPLFAFSFLAGIVLLVRRAGSKNLRIMSAPDDYVAILATCGLLAAAFYSGSHSGREFPLVVYSILLLLYVPLGKLKHMVFFFAARADYGYRLGYRGIYPPRRAKSEQPNAGTR